MTSQWLLSVLGVKAALLALAGLWVARRLNGDARLVWLRACVLALVLLPTLSLILPVLPVPLLPTDPPETPIALQAAQLADTAPAGSVADPLDWPVWAYGGVFGLLLLRLAGQLLVLRGWARRADRADSVGGSSVDGTVVGWSRDVSAPVSFGWLRPVILLPWPWRKDAGHPRVRHALAHEMTHVQRSDWPWLMLQRTVRIALWWNPAVLWLLRRLEEETELACDRQTLHVLRSPVAYARTLLELAGQPAPAAVVAMAGAREWRRRIENTMNYHLEDSMKLTQSKIIGLLAPLALVVPLAACQLTRAAEPPPEPSVVAPAPAAVQAPAAPAVAPPAAAAAVTAPAVAPTTPTAPTPVASEDEHYFAPELAHSEDKLTKEELEYRRQMREERKQAARLAREEAREARSQARAARDEARVLRELKEKELRAAERSMHQAERLRIKAEKQARLAALELDQEAERQQKLVDRQAALAEANQEMQREMLLLQAELEEVRQELDIARRQLEKVRVEEK